MGRQGRAVVFIALLACAPSARAADPILMFLLSVAREMVTNAITSHLAQPRVPEPAVTYPGTAVEPAHLRRLIDECFFYLSSAQRAEIFESLNAELLKPKNAAVRGPMIEYFADRALQVRAAQMRIAQLSYREKQQLAEEFRRETAAIPGEERARLQEVLERGLLPVPSDLNQLLLAALEPASAAPR
jgi:hypothetical protein